MNLRPFSIPGAVRKMVSNNNFGGVKLNGENGEEKSEARNCATKNHYTCNSLNGCNQKQV